MRRPGMILLSVALLVGSVAAFTYTEKLKLERSPVTSARFDRWLSPACGCPTAEADLTFALREPERIDVTVVDGGDRVRTLATGLRRPAGRVSFTWDGRDEAGRVVPDGAYRVRVRLRDERRTIVIPVEVTVDTQPPRVRLVRLSDTIVAPGEEELLVRYQTNEFGEAILLVDGETALRGPERRPGERLLAWDGTMGAAPLAPGTYELAVAVSDRAGNVSEPSEPVTIVVAG